MVGEAEAFQELLGEEIWQTCSTWRNFFAALKGWLMWAVEDEEGLY